MMGYSNARARKEMKDLLNEIKELDEGAWKAISPYIRLPPDESSSFREFNSTRVTRLQVVRDLIKDGEPPGFQGSLYNFFDGNVTNFKLETGMIWTWLKLMKIEGKIKELEEKTSLHWKMITEQE